MVPFGVCSPLWSIWSWRGGPHRCKVRQHNPLPQRRADPSAAVAPCRSLWAQLCLQTDLAPLQVSCTLCPLTRDLADGSTESEEAWCLRCAHVSGYILRSMWHHVLSSTGQPSSQRPWKGMPLCMLASLCAFERVSGVCTVTAGTPGQRKL